LTSGNVVFRDRFRKDAKPAAAAWPGTGARHLGDGWPAAAVAGSASASAGLSGHPSATPSRPELLKIRAILKDQR